MTTALSLAQRSAAATEAKRQIDNERAEALISLTQTDAFAEVLAAVWAIYDPGEQCLAGVNAAASHVCVVLENLAANARAMEGPAPVLQGVAGSPALVSDAG